jgi:transposase
LVKHRSRLEHRLRAALMGFGHACPVSDLFGATGRRLLERPAFPEPWRSDVVAAVALIDDLDRQIGGIERELRQLGAEHRLHDRRRDRRHRALPDPDQVGRLHRAVPPRPPVRCHRPPRPAGQERPHVPALGAAGGRQRGAKVAQIDIARRLTEAIWHMLTRDQPFVPAGATTPFGLPKALIEIAPPDRDSHPTWSSHEDAIER